MIAESYRVDTTPDIDVRFESGRLEIAEGRPGEVDVTVDTSDPGFTVEQRGNSILVSSDKNKPWLSRGSSFVTVRTPPGADVEIALASANVECSVDLGKVSIKTASGDVRLGRASTVVAKTASGDVAIGRVDTALRYTSASGDVIVRDQCHGSVVISTASGAARIEDCQADLAVNTVSGDVQISRFSGRTASFKAMSGGIDIGIPRGTSVDLDVNLLSGRLNLPDPEPKTEPSTHHMTVAAKLVSADLTINRV